MSAWCLIALQLKHTPHLVQMDLTGCVPQEAGQLIHHQAFAGPPRPDDTKVPDGMRQHHVSDKGLVVVHGDVLVCH